MWNGVETGKRRGFKLIFLSPRGLWCLVSSVIRINCVQINKNWSKINCTMRVFTIIVFSGDSWIFIRFFGVFFFLFYILCQMCSILLKISPELPSPVPSSRKSLQLLQVQQCNHESMSHLVFSFFICRWLRCWTDGRNRTNQ